MIPLVVVSGFLEMLFSFKINISSKLTWTVLIPLHQLSYQVFRIQPLLLGLILILSTTVGKPPTADGPPPDPPPTNGSTATPTLRRSSRTSRPPARYGFTHSSLMTTLSSISIPSSYLQAVQQDCWNQAMKEELDASDLNHTWDIVECPSAVKLIGCKWIYSIKLRSDGPLNRHKARLVVLGNRQE